MQGEQASDRKVMAIGGADRVKFLQDLVTNEVGNLGRGLIYNALLSPQGKYLFDFFLFQDGDQIYLDVSSESAPALTARLMMYRLRADVSIEETDINIMRGLGPAPDGAMLDPRHQSLGWRSYRPETGAESCVDWDEIRVLHLIPETGIELVSGESYILEMGFERLNGVDFKKGCYVGQEVTARMKHKTTLKKGLAAVNLSEPASAGTEIIRGNKSIGVLHTVSGTSAIAYLRFDQAGEGMTVGSAEVTLQEPA